RTWQIQDGSLWRAKNSDTLKPMGPWIATHLAPNNLETTIRSNRQVQGQFNTRHKLLDAASPIGKTSRDSPVYPGDAVSLRADGLTGVTRGVWRWGDRPGVGTYH